MQCQSCSAYIALHALLVGGWRGCHRHSGALCRAVQMVNAAAQLLGILVLLCSVRGTLGSTCCTSTGRRRTWPLAGTEYQLYTGTERNEVRGNSRGLIGVVWWPLGICACLWLLPARLGQKGGPTGLKPARVNIITPCHTASPSPSQGDALPGSSHIPRGLHPPQHICSALLLQVLGPCWFTKVHAPCWHASGVLAQHKHAPARVTGSVGCWTMHQAGRQWHDLTC
jgi:hypothetical protein